MERKTNYGKIIAVTVAVVAAFTAMALVVYKLFVKDLAKCYCPLDDCDDEDFLEEDDSCECECIQCEFPSDEEGTEAADVEEA